jgi:hypothetical protein
VSNLPADPIFPNLKHKYTYIHSNTSVLEESYVLRGKLSVCGRDYKKAQGDADDIYDEELVSTIYFIGSPIGYTPRDLYGYLGLVFLLREAPLRYRGSRTELLQVAY